MPAGAVSTPLAQPQPDEDTVHYTELGSTGLTVSVAGLGCGGNSRLGLGTGSSEDEAVALVRAAFDLGVNFIDTAEAYGSESVVGRAVEAAGRDTVVLSTKSRVRIGGALLNAEEVVRNLEASLKRLRTDRVDVFHLHAIAPDLYDHACAEVVPALLRQKEIGKIGHIGITETAPYDPQQKMLGRALGGEGEGDRGCGDVWEVVMFAFNLMNQGARQRVFAHTRRKGVGTLLMFVVRNIFSNPAVLAKTVQALAEEGQIAPELAKRDGPLDFLIHDGGALSLTDAAYRYARHEPGADVTLFGTGSVDHLRANVASILRPPLPEGDRARLAELFGHLSGVGLDMPDRMPKG
jgi:aryl-alcohol dehydrogenase-like predicted oxidoreductase